MERVFRSKVDVRLAALIYGITLMSFFPLFFADTMEFLIILLVVLAFESAVLFGIRYTVTETELTVLCCNIKSGSCRINDIESITATKTLISAPASSLDRIEIKFKGGSMIISPKAKEQFIALLLEENKEIKVN